MDTGPRGRWFFESCGLRDGGLWIGLDPVHPIVDLSDWDVGYMEARPMP